MRVREREREIERERERERWRVREREGEWIYRDVFPGALRPPDPRLAFTCVCVLTGSSYLFLHVGTLHEI